MIEKTCGTRKGGGLTTGPGCTCDGNAHTCVPTICPTCSGTGRESRHIADHSPLAVRSMPHGRRLSSRRTGGRQAWRRSVISTLAARIQSEAIPPLSEGAEEHMSENDSENYEEAVEYLRESVHTKDEEQAALWAECAQAYARARRRRRHS